MRIHPRALARFLAWLSGYFWLPCPVCREPFAGFEWPLGVALYTDSGQWGVCSKPRCVEAAKASRVAYLQHWSK